METNNAINLFDLGLVMEAPTGNTVTVDAPDTDWNAFRILVNGCLAAVVPADMPGLVATTVDAIKADIA